MSYTGVDAQGNSTFCNHPEFVYIKRDLKDANGKLFPMNVMVCSMCFDIAAIDFASNSSKQLDPLEVQATLDNFKTQLGTFKQRNKTLKASLNFANTQIQDLKDQLVKCRNGTA